ncbi:hypothetical protein [Streptomyces sp. NBC_01803]|uniref:hypothetical protein n=1 Tax=Streptomyces sp. NBC_01803 TaxID=2975946 RepID=UPI002DD8F8F4|nr:hypothetical protein [Streptomyces sp. NBC_01803]WSA43558.1 hypothetical protein OIE51_04690 [Streptomyces sp. NBC_01803]
MRTTGSVTEPDVVGDDDDTETAGAEPSGRGRRRRARRGRLSRLLPGRRTLVVALLALTLLAGAGLFVRAAQLEDSDATGNLALADTEATDGVAGEVTNALRTVFSYTPETIAETERRAGDLLAGSAADEYAELMAEVRDLAADQRLSLTTTVVRAGVRDLTEDRAHLLVFLDQVAQRAGEDPTTTAAQLSVTAQRVDDRWQITEITSR